MNGHDFTLEQNTEARMMLAVARRGLAAAINDTENGIGHLSCDDPKIMEQVRAHWRRLYDTYMNADALLSDLESCARHLTDGDKWEPNPIADGMKPMEMAKGCACFIAETPDGVLIIPSEPTPGENTAKRLANTLNALTGDVLLDATGIRLLGTQFLFAYHSRLDRPVDYGVNLTGMRFPDRLGLLDRADRHPGFLPLRPVVANGTGALERSGRELWAITARTLGRLLHADKPQPLDVDTAAAMLSTTPGLLREFERSYHANVLDRKNAPTGPLGPDAKTVVESRSGHGLSDEALALDARIVRELLSDTGVIRFDGERLTTIPALAPVPEKYVTESDVNALQTGERPQLAGELIHRQIDAVNYPLLLDMWRRATDPKRSARQRHEAYGMFRTGLDLLDLDPVMYRMLDMNPASIGHWLPALVKANEGKTFFRIPKTTIAKAPLTLLQLSRVEYESLTAATLDVVDRWAQAAFRLKPDESYFLKTGTFSNKYDFRNAHVTEPHEVMQIGEYLLYLQSQAVEMAGPLSQPATYGVSTTNEMVVREYIPDTHDLPTIYMGLPLRCEYRCFIDCDTDELLGIHPYWDPKVMNHRFRDWPDSDNPHMRHDAVTYKLREPSLMREYEATKDLVATHVVGLLPGLDLAGQWSLDIMRDGDDYWLIDMAPAERSTFYEQAVPKGKRRPMMENWMPELGGKH